ncbi:hypothetical protein BH11ARM2_BH11ARM2_22300 [soil metagenome]
MPGKYLKGAAKACAGKARFETAPEAATHAGGRLRTYRCPICGWWHLTSRGGPATEPPKPKPDGPLAKLADLDWPSVPEPTVPKHENHPSRAVCRGRYDREGRILLEIDDDRLRSLPVPPSERSDYGEGIPVRIAWRSGRPFIVARAL